MRIKKHLKLGTRTSLLAWTQSSQIKAAVERLNPDVKVELIGIKTAGDIIQDKPLYQLEGKDFFVKELDSALLSGAVDFCVHSYKDLSLQRPSGLTLAATTEREDPRDIVFFRKEIRERIRNQTTLRLGSSSPRRVENTPPAIVDLLPGSHSISTVEMVPIRGNVNSRLTKLSDPQLNLDGIILAAAGISRLLRDEKAAAEISPMIKQLPQMLLPLALCPTSPAQGALAVECRSDDDSTLSILAKLNHAETSANVSKERTLMQKWGGGCHQRFGITSIGIKDSNLSVVFSKGLEESGKRIDSIELWPSQIESTPPTGTKWHGSAFKSVKTASEFDMSSIIPFDFLFAAHSEAVLINDNLKSFLGSSEKKIYTSGVKSWSKLAKKGLWISGCADELGKDRVLEMIESPLISFGRRDRWAVFSHQGADWDDLKLFVTYQSSFAGTPDREQLEKLKNSDSIYWTSESQYRELSGNCKEGARHFCGLGKTYKALGKFGVMPTLQF